MRIEAAALTALVEAIFRAAGCDADEAMRIATCLVRANLTGHDSHGVIRVPRYLQWLDEGRVHPGQRIAVVCEADAFAVVDGAHGFGQTIGPQAVQLGIDKARRAGAAVIALRRSGHLGRIGDWAEMAAAAGLVSIHLVNVSGSLLVAPFGGVDRRMATNPLAIGVPVPGATPIILDFATSLVAEGKAMVAYDGGKVLPPDAFVCEDGSLSDDPAVFYGPRHPDADAPPSPAGGTGALRAMGAHKGSGLSILIELLAGALTGSGCAGPGPRPFANGMLSIYLAPERFDTEGGFVAEVKRYVAFVKSARPATPGGEVLVPGEVERRTAAARRATGIPLPDKTWRGLIEAARRLDADKGVIAAALDAAMDEPV
ncbi:MAG: Ldh family oxidoreductase [Alphaproteobacteria bacterium]|nr:MAG: Ldh family oxidoreductase [Alphaproteobacteria bacterium]